MLCLFVLLLISAVPVSAQTPPHPNILVAVDKQSLAAFSPGSPEMHTPGDLSATLLPEDDLMGLIPDSPIPEISSDGNWLVYTLYSPGVILYGQPGTMLKVLPGLPSDEYAVLWTIFSPDSRYLSYTIASYSDWKMGLVELASGKIVEFSGGFAMMPPEQDKSKPLGNMVPNVVKWSADGKTMYLETSIPFLGCRGPHDMYAMDISGVNFDKKQAPLPPTREVTTLGSDIFSYVFSPDDTLLAYAYHDGSCEGDGANAIGYVNLATGENHPIAEGTELQRFMAGDWTTDSRFLLYSMENDSDSSAHVFLFDTTIAQSGEMSSSIPPEIGFDIDAMRTGTNRLLSILAMTDGGESLYSGTLSDGQVLKTYLVASMNIDWLKCENTLFYVAHDRTSQLYSLVLNDASTGVLLLEADDIQLLNCGN